MLQLRLQLRFWLRLRRNEDRGAIAVLTAIVASAVLLSSAALALDVAVLYSERRQLQNGADAAAIAIAQSCARGLANPGNPCSTGMAAALANGNALDANSRVTLICGTAPGLASCPPATTGRTSCPPPSSGGPPYVQVHTRTGTADGANVVTPIFARGIPGMEGYNGTTVGACARAAYGSPASALSALPIAVSQCRVDQYTAEVGGFAPSTLPTATTAVKRQWETTIELHKGSGPCLTASSGQTAPGNFGFLDASDCTVTSTAGSSVTGDPGDSNPGTLGCTDSYLTSQLGKIVYVPVYSSVTGNGSNTRYNVVGFAAFYFTGWELSASSHDSIVTGTPPCEKPVTCISGALLYAVQPVPAPISSGPMFGATVVQLVG